MLALKDLIQRIANIGLTPDVPPRTATRVRIVNLFTVTIVSFSLAVQAVLIPILHPSLMLTGLPFTLALLSTPILSYFRRYRLSRIAHVLIVNLDVFYYSCAFGPQSGMHLFYLPLPFLSLLLFELRDRGLVFLGGSLPILLFCLDTTAGSWLVAPIAQPPHHQTLMLWLFLPVCFLLILAAIHHLWRESEAIERALADSLELTRRDEQRTRAVIDALPDTLQRFSRDGTLLEVHVPHGQPSAPAARLVGRRLEDVLPREAYDTIASAILEIATSGKPQTIHYELKHGDETHQYDARVVACGPDELILVAQDVTDHVLQQQQLEEQRSKMIAASKMSALGEMSGGIAHEINNPLAIIHGKAGQLRALAKRHSLDEGAALAIADKIESTALRISRIVSALRSFARDGERDPWRLMRLDEIVDETLELCAARFQSHEIKFIREPWDSNLMIECRPVQISQVLLNLLNNAHDAVEPLREKWIRLSVEISAEWIDVSITDSGHGVPAPFLDKIMQPFFTTKDPGRGIGLGLSVSSGIVASHNGRLWLDRGSPHTRFTIRLPRRQTEPQKTAA